MNEATYYYGDKPEWSVKWGRDTIVQPSAFDVLQAIGDTSYIPMDRKFPKRGIAYRLFLQYRILVDDELPDELFLAKLAEFGIIDLKVSGQTPPDRFQEAVDFAEAWRDETKQVR